MKTSTKLRLLACVCFVIGVSQLVSRYFQDWLHPVALGTLIIVSIGMYTDAMRIASEESADGWVSILEEQPPDGERVYTYPGWAAGTEGVSIDEWVDNFNNFLMCFEDGHQVTHWKRITIPEK